MDNAPGQLQCFFRKFGTLISGPRSPGWGLRPVFAAGKGVLEFPLEEIRESLSPPTRQAAKRPSGAEPASGPGILPDATILKDPAAGIIFAPGHYSRSPHVPLLAADRVGRFSDAVTAGGCSEPRSSIIPTPHRTPIIVIVGPTASGKSTLGLAVALRFGGEIVNYDSVQIYRGVDIGSGKLPPDERRGIRHHLLDSADPDEVFTAGDYRREATAIIGQLRDRGRLPVLVGGTGLYLRALLQGLFEGPTRSEDLRKRLRTMAGRHLNGNRPFLHRFLSRLDADAASRIHPRDEQKIIRAIEVCLLSRQPMSRMLEKGRTGLQGFEPVKVGLNPDRAELCSRINDRVEEMFKVGILEETRAAMAKANADRVGALKALGYAQAAAYLGGAMSLDEAVHATQAATRRYAKRQMTWFRREKDVCWFSGFGDNSAVQELVLNFLSSRLQKGHKYSAGADGGVRG